MPRWQTPLPPAPVTAVRGARGSGRGIRHVRVKRSPLPGQPRPSPWGSGAALGTRCTPGSVTAAPSSARGSFLLTMNFSAASECPRSGSSTAATGAPAGSAPHSPTSGGERAGHGHSPRGCGEQEANGRYLQFFLPLPCSPLHGAALAARPERSGAAPRDPRSSRRQRPDRGSPGRARPRPELQVPAGPGRPGRGRGRFATAGAANTELRAARGWRGREYGGSFSSSGHGAGRTGALELPGAVAPCPGAGDPRPGRRGAGLRVPR